jgi:hypothetical protein
VKYLCMIYVDEGRLAETPPDVLDAVGAHCVAHTESLAADGRLVAAERLQPTHTATTVRARGDDVTITDGPFAETKEQLAGFYLIEARDLNEAIRVASQIPPGRFGCIEVRPVAPLVDARHSS